MCLGPDIYDGKGNSNVPKYCLDCDGYRCFAWFSGLKISFRVRVRSSHDEILNEKQGP